MECVYIMQAAAHFHGIENIISTLIGPDSILRKIIDGDQDISQSIIDIIKELIMPISKPDLGRVEAIIQTIIDKV